MDENCESLYDNTFCLISGDTVHVREKKNGLYRILYEYVATKPEKIRIRLDRDTQYPHIDEDDAA